MRRLAWTAALALASAAPIARAGEVVVVRMDRATQDRLGVRTSPLAAARRAAGTTAFARALDLGPLAALESDLAVTAAAAQASAAEAARTAALSRADATVSRKVAEAAAAQARGDHAKMALLRTRVGLEWGPGVAAMADARRSRLVSDAAAGRAALVRIDQIGTASAVPRTVELDLGPHGRVQAVVLGPARAGDPRATAPGLLALVTGAPAAWVGAGAAIPVAFSSDGGAGVTIPREALIRTAGATYAYVRRDPGAFERRPVVGGSPQPEGLFAPSGFRSGEAVVTSGAAKLFAAETPAAKGD